MDAASPTSTASDAAPRVTELRDDDAGVIALLLHAPHHLLATRPTLVSQPNTHHTTPALHHRALAHRVLHALSERAEPLPELPVVAPTAPSPPRSVIVRAVVALLKFIPPITVAYLTARSVHPFVPLVLVQFGAFMLFFARYFVSATSPSVLSSSQHVDAISLSTRDAVLRLHAQDIRTMPLSHVRAFRAALKVDVFTYETSTPLGSRTERNVVRGNYLEMITLHRHLVLNDFESHRIAAKVAEALNDALHQWRVKHNIDPPLDVFDMARDAQNSATKCISQNMSLPTDVPNTDRFVIHALAHQRIRCERRRSLADRSLWISLLLFLFVYFLFMSTIDNLAVSKSYSAGISLMSVSVTESKTYKEAWISLPVPALRMLAMMCVGLFSLWWTQTVMRQFIRMESFTFVYKVTADWLWLPKSILAIFTNDYVINVRHVSAIKVFRNRCLNATEVHRAEKGGNDFLGGPRYGIRLFRSNGRQAFQIEELHEGDALYLAHCLRNTYPRICESSSRS